MYKRNAQGWLKHWDFLILDEICLQVALIIAYAVHLGGFVYSATLYRTMAIVLFLLDAVVLIMMNSMHNVLKRGYYKEYAATFKHTILLFILVTGFLFVMKYGGSYSRLVITFTGIFYFVISYLTRILWKKVIIRRGQNKDKKSTLVAVLQPGSAEQMLRRLQENPTDEYRIVGVALTGDDNREEIQGIPVVAKLEDVANYICSRWIDAVYIDSPTADERITKLIRDCRQMAIPVHYHTPGMTQEGALQFVEKVGGTTVMTTTVSYATPRQLFIKRSMDILGGLVGSVFALLVMAIIGPIIKKKSPGPILFKQERIGKNGKHFKFLKIRSMDINADARKKEFMEQNRVKDGMMFKLDFDPRIIGNEILPDGTKKTGIGEFIRKTSLDEFPQFFNVLKGEMSLVGTRPPTVDEWEKYEFHHRARLACKPGITGMWQVSGRSEITDFEEVVKLDTQYIENWSIGLDIKILLKTIKAVFKHEGAM